MSDDDRGDTGPLFGRDEELGLIRSFVEGLDDGGHALLLAGEPGVGKTALLNTAATAAIERGMRVLRAAGAEFETDIPLAALHQLLQPLREDVDQFGGSTRDAIEAALGLSDDGPADQLALCNATLSLLRHAASPGGLLLVVDDLPWLDRQSATVLGFVARRLARGRIQIIGASRAGEVSLLHGVGLPELEVKPLDDESAAFLVDTHFPALAMDVRSRVLAEAAGNPLALLELPAALTGRQDGMAWRLAPHLQMTRRLQSVFGARLGDVAEGTRRLLLLAALDANGDLRILRTACADGEDRLAEAERAGLARVDETAQRLVFTHPLIRSAVVSLSTAADRRRAHEQLAQLYHDQPDRHGWHLAAAAIEPDESVAAVLDDAATRSLRRGDPCSAVAVLVRAAELSPRPTDRSHRLARAAYIGADVTGDLHSVPELLADATLSDPEETDSLQVATTAAFMLITGDGDVDTAHRLLSSALTHHEDGDIDRSAQIEALHTLLRVCYYGGRPELWEDLYGHLERLPDPPADLYVSSRTLSDPVRLAHPAMARFDHAIALLAREVDPAYITRLAFAGIFVDRVSDCRQALWRVVRDGREGGAAGSAIASLAMLSLDAFRTGDWELAEQLALESLDTANTRGGYWTIGGRLVRAHIAAGRGEYDVIDQMTDELKRWAAPRCIGAFTFTTRALAAIGRGDYEAAYQEATKPAPAGVLPSHVPYALWTILELVESAVRTGRHAEAAAHVHALMDADVTSISTRLALATHGAAAIAAPEGQDLRLFEHALALPDVARWPFDRARIQTIYGERLRRHRAVTDAREQLSAALDTFNGLGALPWAARAADELRATGLTRARAGGVGPDTLTPQERKVASLAAEGLTNKQIGERLYLSPRTVGFHLARVFPKLGISSRAALRDALSRLPVQDHDLELDLVDDPRPTRT